MLQKRFSTREKILLVLLALLALGLGYYLFVWVPCEEQTAAAITRQQAADDEYIIETTRYAMLESMREELAAMNAEALQPAEIPAYDNAKRVMQLLNGILEVSQNYSISFDSINFDGNLAIRTMRMSFDCRAYEDAKTIVRALYGGPYRCTISSMTFTAGENQLQTDMRTDTVSVNMIVTFYEYMTEVMDTAEDVPAEEDVAEEEVPAKE